MPQLRIVFWLQHLIIEGLTSKFDSVACLNNLFIFRYTMERGTKLSSFRKKV